MNGRQWMVNIWCAAGLLVFSREAISALPDYELQGVITRAQGTANPAHWCDFSIAVSGPRSLISVRYFNDEYFVCGTDGEDSYLLNEMRPARKRDPDTSQVGYMTSGPLSVQALLPIQLTWIAYASSTYLDANKHVTFPLESFRKVNKFIANRIIRFDAAPGLPQAIQWSYPGRNSAGGYAMERTTNFLGATIPLSWRFDFHGSDGTVVDILSGTITNLSKRNYEGTFLPKLEGNFRVEEWRLEPEIGMAFSVPAVIDDWPKKDDPELQKWWKIYRAAHVQSKRRDVLPWDMRPVLIVLILIAGCAIVLASWRKRVTLD